MLKNIAFAALLIQVAAVSALTTQTLLFSSASTQASNVPPDEPVATAKDCAKATWPDFPAYFAPCRSLAFNAPSAAMKAY
ncbi:MULTISPECIES: hypothetical protein [unclassified Mesorhizobium]|uniref:hypothetical protein n=1 Tax=unclassified Mesorhizobium TaxID=325217 RepID=UPI001CCB7231|nr:MULTISPECIES: hypothetical protein [unclassified Mesorhizobium]MBZ9740544.1 hypothetical protein [Mesorhizobium sp. CO1-1-4]MBZ9800537.1 hypothetical protein [Mesorhizobium sp. ES1-6]